MRESPRLRSRDDPIQIALGFYLEFDWTQGLSENSLTRLNRVAPGLWDKVRQGREFRISHVEALIGAADAFLYRDLKLDRNASKSVRASYFAALRRHRQRELPNEQRLSQLAEHITRERRPYLGSSSIGAWDKADVQYYNKVKRGLEEQPQFQSRATELPAKVFQQWRQTEIARLRKQAVRLEESLTNLPASVIEAPLAYSFFSDFLRKKEKDFGAVLSALSKQKDPEGQKRLMLTLSERQVEEERAPRERADRFFGGPDRWGGSATALSDPKLSWVFDLGWWGLSQSPDYWKEWRKKTSWWRPSALKVLSPETYPKRTLARIKDRALEWGSRGLVGAALAVGLGAGLDIGGYVAFGVQPHLVFPLTGQGGEGTREAPFQSSQSREYREGNSPQNDHLKEPLFRLDLTGALAAKDVPTELALPFREDYDLALSLPNERLGELRTENGPPSPERQVDFEVVTEKPFRSADPIPVTSARGYEVYPEVEIDGKRAEPGREYDLVRAPYSQTFLVLKGEYTLTPRVTYRARFFASPVSEKAAPPSELRLPPIASDKLALIGDLLSEAGFVRLAEKVRALQQKRNGSATVEDLQAIAIGQGYYSRVPAVRARYVDPDNPFLAFQPFLYEGTIAGDCDVWNAVLKYMYQIGFADEPNIEINMESLLVRDPHETVLTGKSLHGRLRITDARFPGQVKRVDGTPRRMDPRNPVSKDEGPGKRRQHSPSPVAWSFLHRLKSRGRLELKESDDAERVRNADADEAAGESARPKTEASHATEPGATPKGDAPPDDLEAAAHHLARGELAARRLRNARRRALLQELKTHRMLLVEAKSAYRPRGAFLGSGAPYEQALTVARLLRDFLEGRIDEASLRSALGTAGREPASLSEALHAVGERLKKNIEALSQRKEIEPGKPRFSESVEEQLATPAIRLFDFLRTADWTPLESESYVEIFEGCKALVLLQ